jgi:hypothetical protein
MVPTENRFDYTLIEALQDDKTDADWDTIHVRRFFGLLGVYCLRLVLAKREPSKTSLSPLPTFIGVYGAESRIFQTI